MKLFIDTSDGEKVVVGIDGEMHETKSRKEKSQRLLPFIDELLKKKGKKIQDVSEVEVVLGPGSYTGLRVGVAVANAIGWALGVKVNGKNISEDGPVAPVYN